MKLGYRFVIYKDVLNSPDADLLQQLNDHDDRPFPGHASNQAASELENDLRSLQEAQEVLCPRVVLGSEGLLGSQLEAAVVQEAEQVGGPVHQLGDGQRVPGSSVVG